MESLALGSN